MRTLILACVLAWPVSTHAQVSCEGLWDMALVARALAEEKLPQDVIVRVLGRVYSAPADLTDTMAALALADHRSASLFARGLRQQCEVQNAPSGNAPSGGT